MNLFTNYAEVKPFLKLVAEEGDAHRNELGFLPASVYEEHALAGRLWVMAADNGQYLGHLLFGGKYPDLKIFQLFVQTDQRGQNVGTSLVKSLIDFATSHQYIAISARVAADLPANNFWERMGFHCSRQIAGGSSTNRILNIRIRYIDAPLLFEMGPRELRQAAAISYEDLPILRTATYALDVNVLIDLDKRRPRYLAVCEIVRAALNHLVRIVATDETSMELARASFLNQSDSGLLLSNLSQIPILPRVDRGILSDLTEKLRRVIFPRRSRHRQNASQDESDLIHLAICIHYKISGFVTSEKAILRSAEVLRRDFDLVILSPFDFLEPDFTATPQRFDLTIRSEGSEISICPFEEAERTTVESFLGVLELPIEAVHAALAPGATGNERRRFSIKVAGSLCGFASWNRPTKLMPHVDLFFYLNEATPGVEHIIDHVLESVSRSSQQSGVYGIQLHHSHGQANTRKIALGRGFGGRGSGPYGTSCLFKVFLCGFVDAAGWSAFAGELRSLAKIEMAPRMPTFEAARSLGLQIVHGPRRKPLAIQLFELETVLSPGVLLFPGRSGVIVPIREAYAEELLGRQSAQTTFLPAREALLRIEKAYFRKPVQVAVFARGMLVVFYVSAGKVKRRRGPMAALCMARITSTAVLHVNEAVFRYERQGVLSTAELSRVADKTGLLHVFTFDNVVQFRQPISLARLKEMGCADDANLVTARALSTEGLQALLRDAFQRVEI